MVAAELMVWHLKARFIRIGEAISSYRMLMHVEEASSRSPQQFSSLIDNIVIMWPRGNPSLDIRINMWWLPLINHYSLCGEGWVSAFLKFRLGKGEQISGGKRTGLIVTISSKAMLPEYYMILRFLLDSFRNCIHYLRVGYFICLF